MLQLPNAATARPVSVMVIDDHRLIREGLASALRGAGMHVAGAFASGEPALECARHEEVGVAVVDLLLEPTSGAMTGMEVIRGLRGLAKAPAILVLSSVGDLDTMHQAYGAGATAYLHKGDAGGEFLVRTVSSLARGEGIADAIRQDAPPASALETAGISPREREVLAYVGAAADNWQIAAFLDISERTVKAHVSALYRKLHKVNRTELALVALEHGLRPPTRP